MNRHQKIVKTSSGLSTGKALLNHIIFSPSQSGETVPLRELGPLKEFCDELEGPSVTEVDTSSSSYTSSIKKKQIGSMLMEKLRTVRKKTKAKQKNGNTESMGKGRQGTTGYQDRKLLVWNNERQVLQVRY